MIVFENIITGETIGVKYDEAGRYEAKLSALINSSNLGPNADRGQDFGWRLQAESQAQIDEWMEDADKTAEVSEATSVPADDLTEAHFLGYMVQKEFRKAAPKVKKTSEKAKAEEEYRKRVEGAKTKAPKKEATKKKD